MSIRTAAELEALDVGSLRRPQSADAVLVCPPEHFDVREVRNVHMEGKIGSVDHAAAVREWEAMVGLFESLGWGVAALAAEPDLVDMVFTRNPSFAGLDREGRPFAIPSRMRHPERAGEVERHRQFWESRGFAIRELPDDAKGIWEGGGDTIWHPQRFLLWGGFGQRSEAAMFEAISAQHDLPVALLELVDPAFYHLDTCLALLDERTAAWVPSAFDAAGRELVEAAFPRRIVVDDGEARTRLACNMFTLDSTNVVLPAGADRTKKRLEDLGFTVHEAHTDEFLKSGGSVYCMCQEIFTRA